MIFNIYIIFSIYNIYIYIYIYIYILYVKYTSMFHFNMSCKIIIRKSCKVKCHMKLYCFFCFEDTYIYYTYIYKWIFCMHFEFIF